MAVVFSDVGGTVFQGAPWSHLRAHPLWNSYRGNLEFARFLPTYIGSKIGTVTETQMRQRWLAGMADVFKGMSRSDLHTLYSETITGELQNIFRKDVIARLQKHKAEGYTVILVSGIFTDLVQLIAENIGIDGAIGTKMGFQDDIATGKLVGIPCVGVQKIDYIKQYLAENHPTVALEDCFGYADSYSDRSLLSAVGHGVATYPDDGMRQEAISSGWEIMPA
ncbi:MAG: HAD-IB family hydrolase [Phototrophicaceae bacterium]